MASDEIMNHFKNIFSDKDNLLIIECVGGGGIVIGAIALMCLCKLFFQKSETQKKVEEYAEEVNAVVDEVLADKKVSYRPGLNYSSE